MKKRLFGILLSVVLLLLAVCTYVSDQIYRAGLPWVQAEAATSVQLRHNWQLEGTIHHETPVIYSVPVDTHVLRRQVQPGEWVLQGTPILQLDPEQLSLQWLQCAAEEEKLLELQDGSASNRQQLFARQIDILQKVKTKLAGLIENDGWICAEKNGLILECITSDRPAAEEALVILGPECGRKRAVFSLSSEQYRYCSEGTLLYTKAVEETEEKEIQFTVERVYYSAVSGSYQCVATTEAPINMMDGQIVTARLSAISPQYECVIPTSAIVDTENGNASFYVLREKRTVLGTEFYAILQSAYIQEKGRIYTAISAPVTDLVVSYWSSPLTDQCAVRLIEQ